MSEEEFLAPYKTGLQQTQKSLIRPSLMRLFKIYIATAPLNHGTDECKTNLS
ncbi:MAG: hypothetical protein Q7T62_06715 [Undibacterium sp.]|nr:hypothetical protein [Undibacterium sp.]